MKKQKKEMKVRAIKKIMKEGKANEPYGVMAIRSLMENANKN